MPLNLISTPRRADTPLGAVSDVAAGLSQLPYRFRREDFQFISIGDTGGFLTIVLNGDETANFEVGQLVYYNCPQLNGTANLTSVSELGGFTYLVTSAVFTITGNAGYVNNITTRPGYLVLIEPVDALTGEAYLPYPETYKVGPNGSLFLNVLNLLVLVQVDGVALNYQLRYSERWAGITRTTTTDLAVFAVAGRKQLLDVGGSNMWEFLLNVSPVAQTTTKFKNPVTWLGWNTATSAIFDKDILTRTGATGIVAAISPLNVNGGALNTLHYPGDVVNLPNIFRQTLPESLKETLNAYYLRVIYEFLNVNTRLTIPINYQIKNPCRNPIMLEWLNGNGVGEQWLFEVMQEINNEAQPGQAYETPRSDTLDNINDTINRLNSGTIQFLTLYAEKLTFDQVFALHEIKESLGVFLWLDQTGVKKIKVIVEGVFNTPINTKASTHDFSVQIRLPRNFNFYK